MHRSGQYLAYPPLARGVLESPPSMPARQAKTGPLGAGARGISLHTLGAAA